MLLIIQNVAEQTQPDSYLLSLAMLLLALTPMLRRRKSCPLILGLGLQELALIVLVLLGVVALVLSGTPIWILLGLLLVVSFVTFVVGSR